MERNGNSLSIDRVIEICKLVPAEHWKHCPGAENPADLPSRGMTATELSVMSVMESWTHVAGE